MVWLIDSPEITSTAQKGHRGAHSVAFNYSKKDWRQGVYFRTKTVQLIFTSVKFLVIMAENSEQRRKNLIQETPACVAGEEGRSAGAHRMVGLLTPCLLLAHSLLAPHSGLAQTLPHWLPRYYRPAPSPQVMPPCWHVPLSELELLGASPKEKLLQAGLVQLHLCESDVTSWAKSPSGGIILENGTLSKWLHLLQFPIINLLFLSISFSLSHFKEATGQIPRCWPPN